MLLVENVARLPLGVSLVRGLAGLRLNRIDSVLFAVHRLLKLLLPMVSSRLVHVVLTQGHLESTGVVLGLDGVVVGGGFGDVVDGVVGEGSREHVGD